MAHKNHKKEQRQLSADERQYHRDNISAADQLDILDRRLGKNIGAQKERARLNNKLMK